MVCGIAMNDMSKGWTKENKREYGLWQNMLKRCYDKKCKDYKYYGAIGCYVCDKWLKLSGFIDDLQKINGYDLWKNNPNQQIALDKDIKSNGTNKCYCLEQCQFVTKTENSKQANKTRNNSYLQGENNPMYGVHRYGKDAPNLGSLVERWSKDGKTLIDVKYQFEYVQMGFNAGNIYSCCNGKLKSVGRGKGTEKFIFKYNGGKK